MYAVIVKDSVTSYSEASHGYHGGCDTTDFEKLIKFKNESDLLHWIKYNSTKKFEIIRYELVTFETRILLKD